MTPAQRELRIILCMTGLHIVIVPSWWPSPEQPYRGIFFTDYARAFAAAGAKVGVVFPDLVSLRMMGSGTTIPLWPKITEEALDGIPVIRIRGLHTALRQPRFQMHRFRGWLRRGLTVYRTRYGTPDLLHAMCAIPAGWACTHFDNPLAEKVVVTELTGPFSLVMTRRGGVSYVRTGLARAAAVVAVSEQSRTEMKTAGIKREIQVCGICVSKALLAAEPVKKRSDRILRALFVGRLTEAKGVDELVKAAVRLAPEYELDWHFVGHGPMEPLIRQQFIAAGLHERLTLHGVCDRHAVVDLMSRSDFLVLPSHGETFGMAVVEALCMGLPVVATHGTACADFISKDNGKLVRKRDVESLTEGLRQLIRDRDSYNPEAIAEQARSRFSPEVLATWYEGLFRRIVGME